METDLRTRLRDNPGVSAIVGTHVDWQDRTALPALTLTLTAPGRTYDHEGANALTGPRVRCDCWGRTPKEASALADALTAAIEPAADVGGTRFFQSFLAGERDGPVETLPGGAKAYRRILDFYVWNKPL